MSSPHTQAELPLISGGRGPEQGRAKFDSLKFAGGFCLGPESRDSAHSVLAPYPAGNSPLIDTKPFGCFGLGAEVLNKVFENVHLEPSYGNAHNVDHGNTRLQGYGSARNTWPMEFKDRLKAARKHAGLNQTELASRSGMTQTSISDLERGKSQSSSFVAQIAQVCGVSPMWLASGEGSMLPQKTAEPAPGSPSEKDYALIPQYTAKGSAGNGHLNEHVEIKGGLAFKRDWLSRLGVKEHRCSVIYAHGSSMEPSIFDGEVVLIDHDDTEPRDAKVYVLQRPDGEIIIKRLIKQMAGWVIRSDNEDKRRYPDEPISADSLQQIEVVGRVVWRGGGM